MGSVRDEQKVKGCSTNELLTTNGPLLIMVSHLSRRYDARYFGRQLFSGAGYYVLGVWRQSMVDVNMDLHRQQSNTSFEPGEVFSGFVEAFLRQTNLK